MIPSEKDLNPKQKIDKDKFGLVLLSTPMSRELLHAAWRMTGKHIVADGGSALLDAARRCAVCFMLAFLVSMGGSVLLCKQL